jgi:hypothetical protein
LTWIPETTTGDQIEVEVNPEVTIVHGGDGDDITEIIKNSTPQEVGYLGVPTSISTSGSADTLVPSAPSSPSNVSNVTLVGSTGSGENRDETPTEPSLSFKYGKAPTSPLPERINPPKRPPRTIEQQQAAFVDTVTVSKIQQQLPQTMVKSINETKPSIIKITAPASASTNIVTITSSTIITTSTVTATSSTKTTISTPSIGVSFDRYCFFLFQLIIMFHYTISYQLNETY